MTTLKKLRLSGLAESLEVRLHEAAATGLSHREFLELLLQDELLIRNQRLIEPPHGRRRASARRAAWRISTSASIPRSRRTASSTWPRAASSASTATCCWWGRRAPARAIWPRPSGLAAIRSGFAVFYRSIFDMVRDFLHDEALAGQERILQRYLKPDLLIIDDMGMKQLPKRSGEYLFEIILRRHEVKSTIMTSNRPLEDWGKLFGDVPSATAILDRFLHHAEMIQITGKSYRLANREKAPKDTKAPTGSAADEKTRK